MSFNRLFDPNVSRILEAVPGILWTTDRELRFTSIYGHGLQDLGLKPEQVIGISLADFFGTERDDLAAIAAHREAMSGGVATCQQNFCGRLFQISVTPNRDLVGIPIGCIGIAQDVTELARSEKQMERTRCLQEGINRILGVFNGPEPIGEQLDRCLAILLSIPSLSIQSCGAIFLVEGEDHALVLKSQRGLPDALRSACARVSLGQCLCGTAALTRKIMYVGTVDDRHETRYEGISDHGHYCVPMLAERELVGVLNLYLEPEHREDWQEEQFLSVVGTVIAHTIKHRQMAEELRESEERFSCAVRGSDAGIWDWDLRTNKVYYSPRWKSMIGYADNEIDDDFAEWEKRVHPDDHARAAATIRNYLDGKLKKYELEHRLRHKDGSYRDILARGAVVRDSAGHAYRMVGSHLDITRRKKLEKVVEEQRAQLIAAEEIQSFLLPKSAPEIDGFEIAGRCFPAEFAAGDYFDYLFLKDGRFLAVVSDVCGHGVGPAILMATVCAHLRSMVAVETDLAQLIRRLNALIFEETPEQRFVTLFIGEIDLVSRSLHYVRCGHPPAIVMNDHGQVMATLDRGNLPLGILPDLECHREGPVQLRSGDVLLLFSDGALEAVSAGDVQFGRERVIATVQKHRQKRPGELIEALYQTARDFVGTRKITDDITILAVKVL